MVDSEGESPLPEFATVYTIKGKLYSTGGYVPKDEIKYEKYRKQYIVSVSKGQRKNNKFFNFMEGKEVPVGVQHKNGSNKLKFFQQLVPRNHFLATYIPTIAQEFRQTNQIEKWERDSYMAAAQATWREVVKEILQIIDLQQNWENNDIFKQGATVFKKQIAQTYFTQINTDELAFATEIDRIYNQIAPAAINETGRRQGVMQQD
ncbi:MAG: hypothetical protein EZS28_039122 [Streblomastix strix]|uniref:Uncharacterized protein n=1 Tax=Streblomastix strix TaxID=222440 RepID=A0A5J4U537_9EUKA|nr:MAG: hypothetical protein EZS28_039122 [Streblomastix strix]